VNLLRLDRSALVGAVVGSAAALASVALGALLDDPAPFTVLMLLAAAVVGLGFGAAAAAWAYIASVVILLLTTVAPPSGSETAPGDVIRLATFLVGTPIIVALAARAEQERHAAAEALAAAEQARHVADDERRGLDTARWELDGALRRAERERARLEEVAEAIPEPLVVFDDQPRGTYGNRAALRLFGRAFVERSIDEWGRMAEPRDQRGATLPRESWPQVRAQSEAIRERLTLRIPMSGRDVMVDVEGTPIPGGGCVLLLRDIGKEEDERRRLSRFASFVAHELRNPLAVAKARIELARRDPQLARRAAGHSARAYESVEAAIGILERLELYSRADSGRIEAERAPFDLRSAVEAAAERLRARGSERELLLDLGDGVIVLGDRHLAEQAITNLLTNADRYSEPDGPIRIEVSDGDPVTLRVGDAGPGIADDVARRLFRDRVEAGRGLGLGLYLVSATMDAMGGSVQLEQRRPAAIFALRWPRAAAAATPPARDS